MMSDKVRQNMITGPPLLLKNDGINHRKNSYWLSTTIEKRTMIRICAGSPLFELSKKVINF